MSIKENMSKLLAKLNDKRKEFINSDIIGLIPKLNEANEYINSIAKFSNDYKLDCAWRCLAQGIDIEKSINELYNYVSDTERAFFITNEFRKIILSNSVHASCVIALIMGKIIKENRKCTHKEAIILNAVSNMTDYDLDNFIEMMTNSIINLAGHEIIVINNLNTATSESYEYTLYTCANSGLFLIKGSLMEKADDGYYSHYEGLHYLVWDASYALMKYIEEVKQILNYQS